MHQHVCYALFFIFTIQPLQSMDLFSPLPNVVRKQIVGPLIDSCDSYDQIKDVLITVSLLSKKSYEQTHCSNFTKDIVSYISHKKPEQFSSRSFIACSINTPGMKKYIKRGNQIIRACELHNYFEQKKRIKKLLNKGADIDYDIFASRKTALMIAVEKRRSQLIDFLIRHGANIHAKSDIGYVRDHSILFTLRWSVPPIKPHLETYFEWLIIAKSAMEQKKAPVHCIQQDLYIYSVSHVIRKAIGIETYFQSLGAPVSKNLYTDVLVKIYEKMPEAPIIMMTICDPKNSPKYNKSPHKSNSPFLSPHYTPTSHTPENVK